MASHRHRVLVDGPMKVLSIHRGQDTGGQGWRITDAFRRLEPDWTVRSVYIPTSFTYLQYPADLEWTKAKEAWREAEIVHLHNDFRTAQIFEQRNGRKPSLIHYHGSAFRRDPVSRLRNQLSRKAVGVVSTLDLWLISPEELEWLPSPYNLDWLRSLTQTSTGSTLAHTLPAPASVPPSMALSKGF